MLALVESDAAPPQLAAVPTWFEEWEQALSRFRSDSELTQLNSNPGQPVRVSDVFWGVYEASLLAAETTAGLVTPLVLEALLFAGYDRSFDLLRPATDPYPLDLPPIHEPGPYGSSANLPQLGHIHVDPITRSLTLPRAALLDFGGIAKGWAAEQAALRLGKFGPALVSAGGDIAVTGPRVGDNPWQIGVEDPFNDGLDADEIFLTHGGVATSGRDRRHWVRAGVSQHHIIDPRTGQPAQTDILTATVIADSAILAEAMAKAVLISGSRAGLDWLDSDSRLAGLLILENGQRLYSRNMDRYL